MISLSQSKIKTYQRCPKQYEYRYIENLQPKVKPLPMERGIWIHECLEAHYRGKSWKKVLKRLEGSFLRLDAEEREEYGDLPGEVRRIIRGYLKYWDDEDWEIIAVEVDFRIVLEDGTVLKGRMDLVIRDNLGVWVVEHKSNKNLPREGPRIPDPQTTLYNYGLRGMKLKGMGTIHNHIRTKAPNEPRVLKRGGLSVRCDTDYRTYMRAIKHEGLDPKDYAIVLRKLKHEDKFFRRFRIPWKKATVKSMLADYGVIADQIDRAERFPRHLNSMCERGCFYFVPCMVELNGGDATSIKKSQFNVDRRRYG